MTFIVLIRHARSAANASGTLAGRLPGIALDDAGRTQAEALEGRLDGLAFDLVLSSPLQRCLETAYLAGLTAEKDERLTECDYGDWSGRPLAELATEPLWAEIQSRPSTVRFPCGESMDEMRARAVAAVADAVGRVGEQGSVAIVSHADVLKAIVSDALAQPFDEFQRIVVDPASVSVLQAGEVSRVWTLNSSSGRVELPGQLAAPR